MHLAQQIRSAKIAPSGMQHANSGKQRRCGGTEWIGMSPFLCKDGTHVVERGTGQG
eukprot:CAMPEP_0194698060 /NCGR_PEP_ID=MMETSP0295-20121207/23832_1 /TAXON_ID=39354 /ORGANISM="Heterosigma akashiwo, Strain CCMP2393" /LENGTH=55 /DNA_ID=CAMNT_0039590921 /DNA_START=285 /DNA_END=452 /DNA_ORIENTATION=-